MNALTDVKSYMTWWGWESGGDPGSVKRDDDGKIVARYGDSVWQNDVERACATLTRIADRLGR